MLTDAGYEVRCAKNGQLALSSINQLPPDMILLDVQMPEISGFEVCNRLKENENTKEIPVIFVSALHDVQDKLKGFQAGGVDYIPKPFQLRYKIDSSLFGIIRM